MEQLSSNYLARAEMWLFVTTLTYFMMNGAQLFETVVLVPGWTRTPPESFQLLRQVDPKAFWITTHCLHEITFILAIVFCWKIEPVRNGLLGLFIIHFAVRVWTLLYFAPNIITFQNPDASLASVPEIAAKARLWEILNYVRVGIFIALSLGLLPLCYKMLKMRVPL